MMFFIERIFPILFIIATIAGIFYGNSSRFRIKRNRNLMEKGYGFLLDDEARKEVLNEGDVEVLRPFQKPKIIKGNNKNDGSVLGQKGE